MRALLCLLLLVSTASANTLRMRRVESMNRHMANQAGAQHWTEDYTITLALDAKGKASVTSKGLRTDHDMTVINNRSHNTDERATWTTTWRGAWTIKANTLSLVLDLVKHDCTGEQDEDGRKSALPCKTPSAKATLTCTTSPIDIAHRASGKSTKSAAWICSPADGTELGFCKSEPRSCDRIPGATEVPEEFFKVRIENGERCIKARDEENRRCWDGGDSDHKDALSDAEKARKVCYDELNTRKGNGGIYTCSDSTYSSRASDVESACSGYGRGCDAWSKDDKVISCSDIEDQMKKAAKCVDAVEKIDSDCLPRLSGRREAQFREGKKAYDLCKEVLEYKKDKKLCK